MHGWLKPQGPMASCSLVRSIQGLSLSVILGQSSVYRVVMLQPHKVLVTPSLAQFNSDKPVLGTSV